MIFPVGWTCPHCQHTGQVNIECQGYGRPEVVFCDTDEGGCGAYVAVVATIQHVITAQAHKIDGVGPEKGGAK